MTTWQQYMIERVEGREGAMPWFLHDKLRCYDFLSSIDIPTVEVLRRFATPAEIELDGLPKEFVLKPTLQSSTKGVMVLRAEEDGWYESLRRRTMTTEQIIEEQAKLFEDSPLPGNKIIVEEKIADAGQFAIPRDFKAYAFRGLVSLVLQIDRNTKPSTVAWFDGAFEPVNDGRVWTNPAYVAEAPAAPPEGAWSLLRIASAVSAAIPTPFASIDMYLTPRGPVVGEITLAPGGLYHGQHYRLSRDQQRLMGWMWEQAAADVLAPASKPIEDPA
ncbi:MAG: ATP-grasp fold amidoligase family protein [Patulibacter sp.]